MALVEQTPTLIRFHQEAGATEAVIGVLALALMGTAVTLFFRLRKRPNTWAPQLLMGMGGFGFILLLEVLKFEARDITFDRAQGQLHIRNAVLLGALKRERHLPFTSLREATVVKKTRTDPEGEETHEYSVDIQVADGDAERLQDFGSAGEAAHETAATVNAFLHPPEAPVAPAPQP